jgi:hypothetical protein
LLLAITTSAEPSASMSAMAGYSQSVPLAWPPCVKRIAPVAPSWMLKLFSSAYSTS